MENRHKHKRRNWHNKQTNNKKENHNEKNESYTKHERKQYICPLCNQPMQEIASALAHKETGEPVHFDCVLDFIKKTEKIGPNERVTYIGQGRFGILYFENPHDLRHFTIKKIIEWENKESVPAWRVELTQFHSQT